MLYGARINLICVANALFIFLSFSYSWCYFFQVVPWYILEMFSQCLLIHFSLITAAFGFPYQDLSNAENRMIFKRKLFNKFVNHFRVKSIWYLNPLSSNSLNSLGDTILLKKRNPCLVPNFSCRAHLNTPSTLIFNLIVPYPHNCYSTPKS